MAHRGSRELRRPLRHLDRRGAGRHERRLELPADAYTDAFQQEWLSRVQLTAFALGASGGEVGNSRLESLWVVWDRGPSELPTWFDRSARSTSAPLGAWSQVARAQVANIVVPNPATTEIQPPRGVR